MICSGYAQAEEDSLTPASWWVTGTSSFKSKHNRGLEKPDFTPRVWTCPLIQGRHEWGIRSPTPEWNKTPECCTVVMYTLMAPSRKILVKEQLVELTAGSVSSAEPLCLCSCQSLGSSKALARGYWGITLSMNLWALHYSTVIACFWLLQHFLHVRILPSQLSFAHLLGAGKEQLLGYSKSFSALFPCRDLLNPALFCEKVTAPTGSVITDNCSWCSSQSLWKPQPKKNLSFGYQLRHAFTVSPEDGNTKKGFWGNIFFCCKMLYLSLQQFTWEDLRNPKCSLTAQAKCSAGNWQCDSEPTSSAKSWLRGEKCEKICR